MGLNDATTPATPPALDDPALLEELHALTARYPTKRGALLPILHRLQERRGHLTPEDLRLAGRVTEISAAEVYSVTSFYTMFRLRPHGRCPLGVCRNIACWLLGSERLLEVIHEELQLLPGQTTPDGLFSLEEVECLGSCGTAPVLEIHGRYHENLTPDRLRELLRDLKARHGSSALRHGA